MTSNCNCKGNVLVYILIAVALMAALTFSISGENRGQQANRMDESRTQLTATDMISHVASVEMALYQMTQFGVNFDEVRFDLPGTTDYASNTAQQIYHPVGGGMLPFETQDEFFDGNGTTGWQFQGNVNIEWSPTTATDLLYSFINIDAGLCSALNQQLLSDATIPTTTMTFANTLAEGGSDDDLIISECASCENVKSMCITDGTTNAYYTIIGAR